MPKADKLAGSFYTETFMRRYIFISSVILSILGYLLSSADHIPFILKIFSPSFVSANRGIETLLGNQNLKTGDQGFEQLSKIMFDMLKKNNPPEELAKINILNFYKLPSNQLTPSDEGLVPIVNVVLSNQQTIRIKLSFLKEAVFDLKSRNLFYCGLILFCLGLTLQFVDFFKK